MTTDDLLTERNRGFADERFRPGLPLLPSLGTIVIGCVDPRVDPAHVLGVELGEAAVLRNVGGRVTPHVLAQLALLGRLGRLLREGGASEVGPPLTDVVVLQHTDCGIARLVDPPDQLADYLGVPADALAGRRVADPDEAVVVDLAALRDSPLPAALRATGAVYDVATGRVRVVAGPAPLRAE